MPYRYWLNHVTAWQKACSLANLKCLLLRSARTANPWVTPLKRLICQGWAVLIRMPSDLWRSSVVKIWSISIVGRVSRGGSRSRKKQQRLSNIAELTGRSNGQRSGDAAEFLLGDERGVGSVTDIELAGLREAADVLRERTG